MALFHACDIRGVALIELTIEIAQKIARAIGALKRCIFLNTSSKSSAHCKAEAEKIKSYSFSKRI